MFSSIFPFRESKLIIKPLLLRKVSPSSSAIESLSLLKDPELALKK